MLCDTSTAVYRTNRCIVQVLCRVLVQPRLEIQLQHVLKASGYETQYIYHLIRHFGGKFNPGTVILRL